MLNVIGMNRFYNLRNFHDMRCKYERVLSIIHQQQNREPQENEVSIVMSKSNLYPYLNDDRYDMDNSTTERFIRPLAGGRKNSLCSQPHGKYIGPIICCCQHGNERAVSFGISEEVLPRNCQSKKGL